MADFMSTTQEPLVFEAAVQRFEDKTISDIRVVCRVFSLNRIIHDDSVKRRMPNLIKPQMTEAQLVHAFTCMINAIMMMWQHELVIQIKW